MASKFAFVAWVLILVLAFVLPNPPNDPPSAPAGCGLVNGAPVYLSAPVTYEEYPWPPIPTEDCPPGGCPIARAAVTAQGVGE